MATVTLERRAPEGRTSLPEMTAKVVKQRGIEQRGQTIAGVGTSRKSAFADIRGLSDKGAQRSIASNEVAHGNYFVNLPNQTLVRYRPEDNDAFVKNTSLGAASTIVPAASKEEDYADSARTIGLLEKAPVQATITIQSFVQRQQPWATTNRFVLASASEASQEKYQLFQTFDQDLIYFFDRNPHIYTYGGVLFNGQDISDDTRFNWRGRFQELYETKLRGTKCVENNARAILTYEDVVREGYLLNFQMTEDASNPMNIPFSFLFFITRETNNLKDNVLNPITATWTLSQLGMLRATRLRKAVLEKDKVAIVRGEKLSNLT